MFFYLALGIFLYASLYCRKIKILKVRQSCVPIASLIAIGGSLFVIGKIFGAYLVRLPSC